MAAPRGGWGWQILPGGKTPENELANSTKLRKISAGRVPAILGFGALFSVVLTTFEYTGGTLRGGRGNNRTVELEEYDRKEEHRLNRRRPIEEAVLNLGEGRGTWLSFFPFFFLPALRCTMPAGRQTDRRAEVETAC